MTEEVQQDGTRSALLLRRLLGRRLDELRSVTKLSRDQAAKQGELSRATLARIETGEPGPMLKVKDLLPLLDLYGAGGEDRELILGMAAEIRNGSTGVWLSTLASSIPEWFQLFVSLEEAAELVQSYEAEVVPGIFQTEAYAEEVIRGMFTDEVVIKNRVTARMERQKLLSHPRSPRYEVIINEATLHRVVGAGDLAKGQLEKLLEMCGHPCVVMRYLPFSAGIHAGLSTSAGFTLMQFPEDRRAGGPLEPPLAYADFPTGAMYMQDSKDVEMYRGIWGRLLEASLGPDSMEAAIIGLKKGLS